MKIKIDKPHMTILVPNLVLGISVFRQAEEKQGCHERIVSKAMEKLLYKFITADESESAVTLDNEQQMILLDTLCGALESLMNMGLENTLEIADKYFGTNFSSGHTISERLATHLCSLILSKFECEVDEAVLLEYRNDKKSGINESLRMFMPKLEKYIEDY